MIADERGNTVCPWVLPCLTPVAIHTCATLVPRTPGHPQPTADGGRVRILPVKFFSRQMKFRS